MTQSNPNLIYGQVPSAADWNSYFSAKLDYLPTGLPVNVGGTGGNTVAEAQTALGYVNSGAAADGLNTVILTGSTQLTSAAHSGKLLDIWSMAANSVITIPQSGNNTVPTGFNCVIGSANASGITILVPSTSVLFLFLPDGTVIGPGASYTIPQGGGHAFHLYEFANSLRLETIGRTIVANAVNPNEAVALGQANSLYAPISSAPTFASTFTYSAGQTLTAAQSGSVIIFNGTTSAEIFTLPAPALGLRYRILQAGLYSLQISTSSGAAINGFGFSGTTSTIIIPALNRYDYPQVDLICDGANWFYSTPYAAIGAGQVPHDVSMYRALNTVYTNSTGKPIEIIIAVGVIFNNAPLVFVYGPSGSEVTFNCAIYAGAVPFTCIINPWETYELQSNGALSPIPSANAWIERY